MQIPILTAALNPSATGAPHWTPSAIRGGMTPSSTKGGGGGGGTTDNSAQCARSGYDCTASGYRSWSISTTCQRRYPNGQFPIGCYY